MPANQPTGKAVRAADAPRFSVRMRRLSDGERLPLVVDAMAEQIEQRTHLRPSLVEVILDNLAVQGYLEVDKYAEAVYIRPAPTLPRVLSD